MMAAIVGCSAPGEWGFSQEIRDRSREGCASVIHESRFLRLLLLLLALGAGFTFQATAQSFSTVYSFTGGSDGGNPLDGPVFSSGYLYGTGSSGGSSGFGVVYKISSTTGQQSVVYSFAGGVDGANPQSGLLFKSGVLYGTTFAGGPAGAGTVFGVTPTGKETVLYTFTGGTDGGSPEATLISGPAGNLYGTTFSGGASGKGTVFELVHPSVKGGAWTEKVLYSFGAGTDGANPVAGVTFDKAGNLYGTTSLGGIYNYGTVFELSPSASGWQENLLYQFQLMNDGGIPYAGVTFMDANTLVGTAADGGQGGPIGGGTVFELTRSSSGWTFNLIYSLAGWGISGTYRTVLLHEGKLYATTHCDGANNAGSVYELTLSGNTFTYTLLYQFTGGTDGLYSFSNLVFDRSGYLWGTTNVGGANGYGVVFKVKP